MFLYTMDFKKISSDMPASLVVEFMNSTINHYDKIVQNYSRIFKVETKADGLFLFFVLLFYLNPIESIFIL
jgi:hypothetical protein